MQIMRRAVPAQGRLVVVPIPDDVDEAEVLSAMQAFLAGHGGVPRCTALVTWADDGTLFARGIDLDSGDGTSGSTCQSLQSSLAALLADLFGTKLRTSWGVGGDVGVGVVHIEELSLSFLREVHDFVTPKTAFIALLTESVDPGAIVRELRHIRGLRVIYGGVPSRWSADGA